MTPELPLPRERDLVFVLPGLWSSGGFRTIYQWMNRLAAAGARVRVVSHCAGPGDALLDPRVERLIPSRARYLARSPARVLAHRLLGDDTPLPVTPAAVTELLPADGCVLTCWCPWLPETSHRRPTVLYAQHWEPIWFRPGSRLHQRTERAMTFGGPTLVNSSWLQQQFPVPGRARLGLVFPGVDHAVFHPKPASVRTSDRTLRIVALGRDEPVKGLAELRAAVQQLSEQRPVELRLFGTPGTWSTQAGQVREIGLGNLSSQQLAEAYRASDLVVTPSWYESFPLPPLEAMACGVPVLTTRPGTEDFATDGVNAIVVPPKDAHALAVAMERLAEPTLRADLAAAGIETAKAFTWDAGYATFVAGLDKVLTAG